ncbi:MoaD/ThiS family protein [Hellea balneolensis]|uniref:MoaD/ThiS family protein n=1 Tax=Hellea balneolensis TaxID=287478 RepID=UPI0004014CFD|nr:MoaD/ThiS family protein [Hellea balneolensis]
MIEILFFGRLGDASDTLRIDKPKDVSDTDALTAWLSKQNRTLEAELNKAGNRIAVNKTIISENTPLNDGDEIAYMSPLSGG